MHPGSWRLVHDLRPGGRRRSGHAHRRLLRRLPEQNNRLAEKRRPSQKNIGYVDCFAIHYFHGSKARRGYSTRDTILARHQFAPTTDLRRDWQGIYQLTPDKPGLRDDIRHTSSADPRQPGIASNRETSCVSDPSWSPDHITLPPRGAGCQPLVPISPRTPQWRFIRLGIGPLWGRRENRVGG